jgi:hypothetical protein
MVRVTWSPPLCDNRSRSEILLPNHRPYRQSYILSPLSKYLIMRIGGDPAFFLSFFTNPQCRRSPFHHLCLYGHPTIFPFPGHMSYTALQPRCSISLWTLLFIVLPASQIDQKSDRKATDTNTRWILVGRRDSGYFNIITYSIPGIVWERTRTSDPEALVSLQSTPPADRLESERVKQRLRHRCNFQSENTSNPLQTLGLEVFI